MNARHEIVIVGAGVVGLAAAALLAKRCDGAQLRITVVDREAPAAPADTTGLRVSALSVGSLALLEDLGAWDDDLQALSGPYRDMRVWDAASTAEAGDALRFSAAEFALPTLGYIVDDAALRHRLAALLDDSPVTLRFGAGIEALQADDTGYRLQLEDGGSLHAQLVIGADGGNSAVRRAAGIEVDGWQYGQAALVTHASCERPHRDTAWQRFLPGGPIALLPLADGRVSIVWSLPAADSETLKAADDTALSAALSEASDFVLGELTVAAPRAVFPLRAQHARTYVQRHLALIGDAAHTVHPLAGQGANLGLADASVLSDVIAGAIDSGEWPGDLPVLRRFERARRGSNALMLGFIDSLNRLFGIDAGWMSALRGTGMRLFNRSGPLKAAAMRTALGLEQRPRH